MNEDMEMDTSFDDEGHIAAQRLHDASAPSAFGLFASTALHKHAPLPVPEAVKRMPTSAVHDKQPSIVVAKALRTQPSETPSNAILLKKGLFADYKPWTGTSSEDVLNQDVIRSGFTDKSAVTAQTETNTARHSLWQSMKNKNGLPLLSMLLVQAMDKRQALGKCTTPSTFKPPPRVTLTDTKREAWLRDLASRDVPLRRLSRTIPHGIRGKPLLDQCLAKEVPLGRAIWLIKCVGANEIRAFRRKGMSGAVAHSGEVKWIKEWTLCVEQFVAAMVSSCGQKDWKAHIRYTVRLIATLYTEDLLDHQHFLDWLIASFSSSHAETLPMWSFLVQIFWTHITGVQKRGQLLTEAIASQLASLSARPASSLLDPLLSSLRRYLLKLVTDHKECAIGLNDWSTVKATLLVMAEQVGDHRSRVAINEVINCNDRLNPSSASLSTTRKPPSKLLFEYLDALPPKISPEECAEKCKVICPDELLLTGSLLDWGSSIYRTGITRIYHTIRILQQLGSTGMIPGYGIVRAIFDPNAQIARDQVLFSKIVTDLVLSGHFAYGKYLQALISSGVALKQDAPQCSLLFNIPDTILSPQQISLRRAILSRIHVISSDEISVASLQSQLGNMLHDSGSVAVTEVDRMLMQFFDMKSTGMGNVCKYLLDTLERSRTGKEPMTLDSLSFSTVRTILEGALDYAALSTVLGGLMPDSAPLLVTDFAATIERHLSIFGAIGSLEMLTSRLLQCYARARRDVRLDKPCILSTMAICRIQPAFAGQITYLENDLLTCEQQHPAAVCSPASDSILAVQNGTINADEDIDRILASGNTMDEQMLARLFSAIVERTVKWTVHGSVSLSGPSKWFSQLRTFDIPTFDRHMNNLVSKLVVNAGTDQVRAIIIALVASGCLRLEDTLSGFEKRLDALEAAAAPQLARFAIGTLQTLLPLDDLESQSRCAEIYRFRTAQRHVCDQHRSTVLRFVWHALSAPSEMSNLLFTKPVVMWLSACCVEDPAAVQSSLHLHESGGEHRNDQLMKLLTAMSTGAPILGSPPAVAEALDCGALIQSSNALRLPHTRMILRKFCSGASQEAQHHEIVQPLMAAIREDNALWPYLIDSVGTTVVRQLRHEACDLILRTAEHFASGSLSSIDEAKISNSLTVATMTSPHAMPDDTVLAERVADALFALREKANISSGKLGPDEMAVFM